MIDYVTIVSNVGFPIATAVYFMFRFEKKMQENTKALTELSIIIAQCNTKK